jgi:2,5-diamino-6-(ribosylamino)-4(3H)-pyrimidinone 5'-phosphate reductase
MDRPYVIMNAAMSCDGKLTLPSRERFRLSDDQDTAATDLLRRSVDAILIGATTLEKDNPSLVLRNRNNKLWRKEKGLPEEPAKIGISPKCEINIESSFLQKGTGDKYVFTTSHATRENIDRIRGLNTVVIQHMHERVHIPELLDELYYRGIKRLLLEGGGSTNFEFLKYKAVDEVRLAIAPCLIGGKESPTLVDGNGFNSCSVLKLNLNECYTLEDVVILKYRIDYNTPFIASSF